MIDLSKLITAEQKALEEFTSGKATQFATFNADKTKFIDVLTCMAGRAYRKGDLVTADACDAVAEGLMVLKDQPEVLAATDLLSLKQAMQLCYGRLLVGVPLSVKAVFAKAKS